MRMNVSGMRTAGFEGFVHFANLAKQTSASPLGVPDVPGVYAVVRTAEDPPVFLPTGTGGHFKGRNPNVSPDILAAQVG